MKKIVSLLISVSVIISCMMAMTVISHAVITDSMVVDGIKYSFVKQWGDPVAAAVSGYEGTDSTVVIPEKVTLTTFDDEHGVYVEKEWDVTEIKSYAFNGNTVVEKIIIPDSITTIGSSAFYNATSLKTLGNATVKDGVVEIPDTVTTVEFGTFSGCSSIKKAVMPACLNSIPESMFADCTSLTTVDFSKAMYTSIEYGAFKGCTSLTKFTMPDSISYIESDAFAGCTGLTELHLSTELTSLPSGMLDNCTSLKKINIPQGITSFPNKLFYYCWPLETVEYFDGNIADWKKIAKGTDNTSNLSTALIRCMDGDYHEKHATRTLRLKKAATTTADGTKEWVCDRCGAVTSTEKINKISTVKISKSTYVYSGRPQKPEVIVKDSTGADLSSSDYTLTYSNNSSYKAGKYTVKVTFKNNYSGSKTFTYKINPKKTSISSLTALSKGFTVKWKKQSVDTTGYQIKYSTSSKFTSSTSKTITISKTSTISKKVTKLKARKKYFVKVRVYKTVGSTKYYSAWSSVKSITTKK